MNHIETRFPTRNTKLAAALLCLDFRLKTTDPFQLTTETKPGGIEFVLTYWFEPSRKADGMLASATEQAWETGGVYYLDYMRKALEKRDWLIKKIVTGEEADKFGKSVLARIPSEHYATDKLREAALFCGMDCHLIGYHDRKFYFPKATPGCPLTIKQILAQLKMSPQEMAQRKLQDGPVSYMRAVLEQYQILTRVVQENIRRAELLIPSNERGDIAIFPKESDANFQRKMMHELLRMQERR